MFRIRCKQFWKSPVMITSTFIYLMWIVGRMQVVFFSKELVIGGRISYPFMFVPVSFVYFLFISYAFFSKDNTNKIDEAIEVTGGKIRHYIVGVGVINIANVILFLVLFLFLFMGFYGTGELFNGEKLLFGVKAFLYHIILVNFFAVLAGVVVSFIRSTMKAYAVLMGISCLFSEFFQNVLYAFAGKSEVLNQVVDIFSLTTNDYNVASDSDYIWSVENVEWQRILFWIMLALTIFLYQTIKKNKKTWISISAVTTGLVLIFYMIPNGVYKVKISGKDAQNQEYSYYDAHPEQVSTSEEDTYKEAFRITKYEAKLYPKRVLKATVKTYVDKTDLPNYVFSLRHEYRVKTVKDEQGNQLAFVQDGDIVTITPQSGLASRFYEFQYQGAAQPYFATNQAIRLPAYFAYLPFSGERKLWNKWEEPIEDGQYTEILYEGNSLEGLGYKTEFDIKIDSKQKVYSNLPEVDKNHFRGISDGATFMANIFLEEIEIHGTRLIYPGAEHRYLPNIEESFSLLPEWEGLIAENPTLSGKTIFVMGIAYGSESEYQYYGADHLVTTVPSSDNYKKYLETGKVPYYDREAIKNGQEMLDEFEQMEEAEGME